MGWQDSPPVAGNGAPKWASSPVSGGSPKWASSAPIQSVKPQPEKSLLGKIAEIPERYFEEVTAGQRRLAEAYLPAPGKSVVADAVRGAQAGAAALIPGTTPDPDRKYGFGLFDPDAKLATKFSPTEKIDLVGKSGNIVKDTVTNVAGNALRTLGSGPLVDQSVQSAYDEYPGYEALGDISLAVGNVATGSQMTGPSNIAKGASAAQKAAGYGKAGLKTAALTAGEEVRQRGSESTPRGVAGSAVGGFLGGASGTIGGRLGAEAPSAVSAFMRNLGVSVSGDLGGTVAEMEIRTPGVTERVLMGDATPEEQKQYWKTLAITAGLNLATAGVEAKARGAEIKADNAAEAARIKAEDDEKTAEFLAKRARSEWAKYRAAQEQAIAPENRQLEQGENFSIITNRPDVQEELLAREGGEAVARNVQEAARQSMATPLEAEGAPYLKGVIHQAEIAEGTAPPPSTEMVKYVPPPLEEPNFVLPGGKSDEKIRAAKANIEVAELARKSGIPAENIQPIVNHAMRDPNFDARIRSVLRQRIGRQVVERNDVKFAAESVGMKPDEVAAVVKQAAMNPQFAESFVNSAADQLGYRPQPQEPVDVTQTVSRITEPAEARVEAAGGGARGVEGEGAGVTYDPVGGWNQTLGLNPTRGEFVPGGPEDYPGNPEALNLKPTRKSVAGTVKAPTVDINAEQLDAPGGIKVSPKPGKAPKSVTALIDKFEKAVGFKIFHARIPGGGEGLYDPNTGASLKKDAGSIGVVAHEGAGHRFSDEYKILAPYKSAATSPLDAELLPFAKTGTQYPDIQRQREEGLSEWMRAWMLNPAAAEAAAPTVHARVMLQLPPKIQKAMTDLSNDVRAMAALAPDGQVLMNAPVWQDKPGIGARVKQFLNDLRPSTKDNFRITAWDRFREAFERERVIVEKFWEWATRLKGGNPDTMPAGKNFTKVQDLFFGGAGSTMDTMQKLGPIDMKGKPVIPEVAKQPHGLSGYLSLWDLVPKAERTFERLEKNIKNIMVLGFSRRVIEKSQQFADAANKRAQNILDMAEADVQDLNPKMFGYKKRVASIRKKAQDAARKIVYDTEQQIASIAGFTGGIEGDVKVANKAIAELAMRPDEMALAEEGLRRYNLVADRVLMNLVEAGRLSPEAYQKIKDANQQYISMSRVMEADDFKVWDKFKGSQREIHNPVVSLMHNMDRAWKAARWNQVKNLWLSPWVDSPRGMGEDNFPGNASEFIRPAAKGETDVEVFWQNGKPSYWKVAPEIKRAMTISALTDGYAGKIIHTLGAPIRGLATVFRNLVTHGPKFLIRNPIRDVGALGMYSEAGAVLPRIATEAESDRIGIMGGFNAGHNTSGDFGGRESYYKGLKKDLKDMTANPIAKGVNKIVNPAEWWNMLTTLSKGSESLARTAEFRATKKKIMEEIADGKRPGWTEYDAEVEATHAYRNVSVDFAVKGRLFKHFAPYMPFMNPRFQGLSKFVRHIAKNGLKPKDMVGMTIKMLPYIIAPSVAPLLYAYANGPEALERYRQKRDDRFYSFEQEDGSWIMIPKPFEWGTVGSYIERQADYQMGNTKAFDGYSHSLMDSFAPLAYTDIGGILKPIVDVAYGRDLRLNRDIVPAGERNKDLEMRAGTTKASSIGQWLQDPLRMDARNVDYLMKSYLGDFANIPMTVETMNRKDQPILPTDWGSIFTGMVRGPSGYESRDVREVMDLARRTGQTDDIDSIYNDLEKAREAKTAEDRARFSARARATAKRKIPILERKAAQDLKQLNRKKERDREKEMAR